MLLSTEDEYEGVGRRSGAAANSAAPAHSGEPLSLEWWLTRSTLLVCACRTVTNLAHEQFK